MKASQLQCFISLLSDIQYIDIFPLKYIYIKKCKTLYCYVVKEINHSKINSILINMSINSKYIFGKSSTIRAGEKQDVETRSLCSAANLL